MRPKVYCDICGCHVPRDQLENHKEGKRHRRNNLNRVKSSEALDPSEPDKKIPRKYDWAGGVDSQERVPERVPERISKGIPEGILVENEGSIQGGLSQFDWVLIFRGCIRDHFNESLPSETLIQLQELAFLFFHRLLQLDEIPIRRKDDFIVVVRMIYSALVLDQEWHESNLTVAVRLALMKLLELNFDLTETIRVVSMSIQPLYFCKAIYRIFCTADRVNNPTTTISYLENELMKWASYEEISALMNEVSNANAIQERILENYSNIVKNHVDIYVEAKQGFKDHANAQEK
jgi:hypothetical protein